MSELQSQNTTSFTIRTGTIDEVVALSRKIPEFINPHDELEYHKRLKGQNSLVLVAEANNEVVGFKVGYDKRQDGSLYSWMGAVTPDYRRFGVAKALADHQENWAKKEGYQSIRFKTRNNLKGMLIFALKNGFNIISVERRSKIEEHRIVLEKSLHE